MGIYIYIHICWDLHWSPTVYGNYHMGLVTHAYCLRSLNMQQLKHTLIVVLTRLLCFCKPFYGKMSELPKVG